MVITDVNQVVYLGDGVTTAFPFTFRIIDATDIKLLLIDADGTEIAITSDYFVDINTNTVHYPGYAPGAEPPEADQPPVLSADQKLIVYRTLPITQEKDLGDKWPFAVIELGLDKLTMILQDIWDWCGRCLQVSRGQAAAAGDDFDPTIPLEVDKVIAGNANGTGFEAREALMEVNGAWDGEGRQIHSVADPTGDQDAATKIYVDSYADGNFMKLQAGGEAWESRNVPIRNVAGPVQVNDAATKDYVDRILNGFVLAGDSRTVPFDNVAQMKASDIEAGQIAFTLGYYDVNDGGAGVYNIRTATLSDVDDGGSIIILDNGNVAELIIGDTVNVHQFGAKGNANYYNYTDGNSYVNADTSSATAANYIDNVTTDIVKNYVSAVFETEGIYENPADGKHYVNYDSDTDTYTDEAPYHDNVADKWYVTATYSNKANALLDGTWYYGVVFSTPANDDTTAIQNAINTHKAIELLNGHTYVVTSVTIFPGFILHGNGATIIKPNLKLAPYNYTDDQIKNLRLFVNSGTNYNDVQTEVRDVTINGNAFSMWNPLVDSKYKYEQAVFFIVNGTADYHLKILFDNVHFANHFASSVTINNYADVIITNSSAYNCLKGICTCVGDGNTLNMDNVSADSDYGFTAFWVEVSSIAGQRTDYNINNSFFKGRFEFLGQSSGNLNLTNSVLLGSAESSTLRPGTDFNVNIANCKITSDYRWAMRGHGNINIDNCDVSCSIAFVKTVSNDYNVRFKMSNCVVHDVSHCIGTDSNVQPEIIIDGCRFYNVSEYVFGHSIGTTKWQCKNCSITNCVIDTEGYLYSATGSGSVPFVMGGGNDIINPNCQGINLYGGEQLIFKDEYWAAPAKIKTYRSGAAFNPIGFGKRTTFVAEAPTFRGVNDTDHAQLTVSPYTKYTYTNNAWVVDT